MTTETIAEAPKRTPTVLTQDNMDAWYDEKLGVKKEDPPAEVKEPPKAEDAEEEIKRESKGNKKIESRFSELAKARREAEEKAKAASEETRKERETRLALEAERDALKAKYEPPKTDPLGPEPQPDQFANPKEYGEALKDWTAEKLSRDRQKQESEDAQRKAQEKQAAEWKTRQDATRKEIEDYDAKINSSDVKVSDAVRDAILDSEVGPQLLYHLATNPGVAEKLSGLAERSALRELGKIEAKLGEPKKAETSLAEVKETAATEISKAPTPATPLRSGSGGDIPRVDGDGKYHGTYAQYKADRAAGKIK